MISYSKGVLDHCEDSSVTETQRQVVTTRCEELLQSGCDSPYLAGFLVELYKLQLEDNPEADKTALVAKISDICNKLAGEIDIVRCKYWRFISDSVTNKYV